MGSAPLEHIADIVDITNITNITDIVVEENHDVYYELNKNLRGFPTNLDT